MLGDGDHVLARPFGCDLAEQEHAQQMRLAVGRIVLRVQHPPQQFGTSGLR